MDYYYDYDEVEGVESYEYDSYAEIFMESAWTDAVTSCIRPSFDQSTRYILGLLAGNIACRILWYGVRNLRLASWLYHVCSILCGFNLLYFTTGYDFVMVLVVCIFVYVLILMVVYKRYNCVGLIVAVGTISFLLVYEILWNHPEVWQRIRGIQMIATMKVISLAYDLEDYSSSGEATEIKSVSTKKKSVPALVPYLGYIFCPATCVMGPWVPYKCYLRSIHKVRYGYRWITWVISNAFCAVIFLCMSNCVAPMVYNDEQWKWMVAFRDALSVRCSHYFICFVSQAMLAAAGISLHLSDQHPVFGDMVTKPWHVEFPRSLPSLVRLWNIPMHDWLKRYVFRPLCSRYNYLLALLCTYIVSSLLHGLHLKIYLVLLSLGAFAYAEAVLRLKLASVFSACIAANSCGGTCRYTHCPSRRPRQWSSSITVWFLNLVFSILTVINLAYLGIILGGSALNALEDYSGWLDISEELKTWAGLNYVSHWMAVFMYLFYSVI